MTSKTKIHRHTGEQAHKHEMKRTQRPHWCDSLYDLTWYTDELFKSILYCCSKPALGLHLPRAYSLVLTPRSTNCLPITNPPRNLYVSRRETDKTLPNALQRPLCHATNQRVNTSNILLTIGLSPLCGGLLGSETSWEDSVPVPGFGACAVLILGT